MKILVFKRGNSHLQITIDIHVWYSINSTLTLVNNVLHMILHSISCDSVHDFIKQAVQNLGQANNNNNDLKSRLMDDVIKTITVSLLGANIKKQKLH